jgi:hypothetical protein
MDSNPLARWLEGPERMIAIIGGWWLLALAFLTVFEIFARKLLAFSLLGVDEIGAYTLAIFSTLSFAYALVVRSHNPGRLPARTFAGAPSRCAECAGLPAVGADGRLCGVARRRGPSRDH